MTTKREQLAEAVYQALQANVALRALGVAFSRSVFAALDLRDKKRVLVVHHGKERTGEESTAQIDRHTTLIVTVVTRDANPDSLSEEALALAQPVVMTLSHPDLIDVAELGTDEPSYDNLGGVVSARAIHFSLFYRTSRDSLSA